MYTEESNSKTTFNVIYPVLASAFRVAAAEEELKGRFGDGTIGDLPDVYSVHPFGDQPPPPPAPTPTPSASFGHGFQGGGTAAQRGFQDFYNRRRQMLLGGEQHGTADTRGRYPVLDF